MNQDDFILRITIVAVVTLLFMALFGTSHQDQPVTPQPTCKELHHATL